MLPKLRSRLTYANVMATIAVFMALGGGAYAAIKLPANSVGSKQIKKKAVTPSKVAPATVRLFKGQKGAPGTVGPKGDTGAAGQSGTNGQQGSPGASLVNGWYSNASNLAGNTNYLVPFEDTFSAASAQNASVVAPQAFVARDLYVRLNNAPGAGAARSYTLVVDGAPTLLTCSVAGLLTTCENGAVTATVPKGSLYTIKMTNSSPAPADFGFMRWAFRATTP